MLGEGLRGHDVEGIYDTANARDTKDLHDTEDIHNAEGFHDTEDIHNSKGIYETEDIHDAEDIDDTEDTFGAEDSYDTDDIPDAENIRNPRYARIILLKRNYLKDCTVCQTIIFSNPISQVLNVLRSLFVLNAALACAPCRTATRQVANCLCDKQWAKFRMSPFKLFDADAPIDLIYNSMRAPPRLRHQ